MRCELAAFISHGRDTLEPPDRKRNIPGNLFWKITLSISLHELGILIVLMVQSWSPRFSSQTGPDASAGAMLHFPTRASSIPISNRCMKFYELQVESLTLHRSMYIAPRNQRQTDARSRHPSSWRAVVSTLLGAVRGLYARDFLRYALDTGRATYPTIFEERLPRLR